MTYGNFDDTGELRVRPDQDTGAREALLAPSDTVSARMSLSKVDWRQGLGLVLILVGFAVVIAAWFGASGTTNVASEFSYAISGGVGGGAAVIVGVMFIVSYEHYLDRTAMAGLEARLRLLESGLTAEFDHVVAEIRAHGEPSRTNGRSSAPPAEAVTRVRRTRNA